MITPRDFTAWARLEAAPEPKDFSALQKLQQAAGDKFVQGVLLHDHDRVTPHSEKIRAAPVSLLWQM
jgi:hypothetical protein